MGIEDLSIIESQWRVRLSEDPAPELFDGIGARLSQYYCGADIERESVNRDLIGFAKAFVGWSADPKSDERIREIYACVGEDEDWTRIVRACFGTYKASCRPRWCIRACIFCTPNGSPINV